MSAQSSFAAAVIQSARRAHAAGVALRLHAKRPDLCAALGERAFGELTDHNAGLLDHLAAALAVGEPILFEEHVAWQQGAFAARGIALATLADALACLGEEMRESLPEPAALLALAYVEAAHGRLQRPPVATPGPFEHGGAHVELARRYLLAALEGRRDDAIQIAVEALDDGLSVPNLYSGVLGPAQIELGLMWQRGEIHVAEEHRVSRITEAVMAAVSPKLPRQPKNGRRALLTSAPGDLHDIGLRMVADHLEMAGWTVVYLGADTPAADLTLGVRDFDVDLVVISAKLSLHLGAVIDIIERIRAQSASSDKRVAILVGGHPFKIAPKLWKFVGADGCAQSAIEAVEVAGLLMRRA